MTEPRWLSEGEQQAWIPIASMMLRVPCHLEEALAPHKVSFFEYTILVVLSHAEDRTLAMKTLADLARGSLSRMSHASRRLEKRGLLNRFRCPNDGRVTLVKLTDSGFELLQAAAPDHVESVREAVFDVLTPEQVAEFADYCGRINAHLQPDD